ncbi:uncharacterized protein LOC129600048 [Paramacrobiotus metropolitanus]|uniref:uncharacterized protein LOC129600048 n=1 Tax=Paramacrobiotus metropolitanus TaxID=2943436 RepID=UPI0024460499|nr:uncharacterized protein LOC129600048 [Paramacrobiotus metropolitanus]
MDRLSDDLDKQQISREQSNSPGKTEEENDDPPEYQDAMDETSTSQRQARKPPGSAQHHTALFNAEEANLMAAVKTAKQEKTSSGNSHFYSANQDSYAQKPESNREEFAETFIDMHLKPALLRGVSECGFFRPYPLQQLAILPYLKGRDVVVQGHTRSGQKTSFVISVLQKIDIESAECQALIVAPYKETAEEIKQIVLDLAKFTETKCRLCVGGTNVLSDMMELSKGRHIVVGTPGRIQDMILRRVLKTNDIQMVVMDDADALLSRGLTDQLRDILTSLPKGVQVLLATRAISPHITEVTRRFMRDPVQIVIQADPRERPLNAVRQFFLIVDRKDWKLQTLCDLLENIHVPQTVIFCNTRREVDYLAHQQRKHTLAAIHGEMPERDRVIVFQKFRQGALPIVVTTDRYARSVFEREVNLVISYDMPSNRDHYINRMEFGGRECRERKGCAITFVTNNDLHFLKDIEQFYGTKIEAMPGNVAELFEKK